MNKKQIVYTIKEEIDYYPYTDLPQPSSRTFSPAPPLSEPCFIRAPGTNASFIRYPLKQKTAKI